MKATNTVILVVIIAVLGFGAYLIWGAGGEENPNNGSNVTDNTNGDNTPESVVYKDLIRVERPLPEDVVSSPLVIEGEARGNWFFEATFPVTLTDWDGRIIAEHYAEAQLDPNDPDSTWMTTEYVPFRAVLEFEVPEDIGATNHWGSLILHKSNASGLPEHDDALEYMVWFSEPTQ